MKKTILFALLTANISFSQWNLGTNIIYSNNPVVSIGASSIQGNYGTSPTGSALEIVSNWGSGSVINFKTGLESAFLSFHSIYQPEFDY